ncbi:hypothetical protein ACFXDJ_12965 [Streptomyces sp. NPDC059443]|uniref:hypothetical protein n=1 Tax=unclassified Streptomyces TaxID=2593676 RepID=UPI0036A49A6F
MSVQNMNVAGTIAPALRTWSTRAARTAMALPVGVACVGLALIGQGQRADRLQTRVSGVAGWTGPRVAARTLLGLPLDLAALALVAYSLFNTVRNLGYPIWYGDTDYHQAWGGPTLTGVWLVHALGWLACLYAIGWILRGIAGAQHALTRRIAKTTPA